MKTKLENTFKEFVDKYEALHREQDVPLLIEYDEQWPSACYQSEQAIKGLVPWQPQLRESTGTIHNLSVALDIEVNSQLSDYYGLFWSDHLLAKATQGSLQLLQAWNEEDFERLQENLIAHVLMKRQLGQRDTLFFALTDQEDFLISILNETGEVVLEQVGLEVSQVLAPDLQHFIQSLQPEITTSGL